MEKINSFKYALLSSAITLILFSNFSLAQEAALHVDFTGSSFNAHSTQLVGVARLTGKKVTADRLVLNLKSMSTGVNLRDQHLWKAFEADKYPQAILSNVVGEDGKFKGDLTVHGVTKKGVEGEYTIVKNKVQASFKTNMTDYKIPPQSYMGGTISVEDEVEIKAGIPLVATAPAKR